MLSLAPLLILLLTGIAQLPLQNVLDSFLEALNKGLPDNVVRLLDSQIRDIQSNASVGLSVLAAGVFMVSGTRAFLTIGAGLDVCYGVSRRRLRAGLISLLLAVGFVLLLLVAMVLLVVLPIISNALTEWIHSDRFHLLMSTGVRWGIACGFMLLSTTVIYRVVPSAKLHWYWLSPGSVFATVGWVVVTQGFRIYVERFAMYSRTYGALGGVIVLMIWLYMTGAVLMMGGQINSVIERSGQSFQESTKKVRTSK